MLEASFSFNNIKVIFYPAFVCLSVSLLATLCKNADLRDNFTRHVSEDMEELIEVWKSSTSGFGNCLKDSSSLPL